MIRGHKDMATLLELPAELLCQIASYLADYTEDDKSGPYLKKCQNNGNDEAYLDDYRDFGRLRLACRELYKTSFTVFAAKVLGQSWRLSERSLRTLINIADDTRLKDRIKHICIDTHYLFAFSFRETEDWQEWVDQSRRQADFFRDGRDVSTLTLALSKMPKLDTVVIGQWCRTGEAARVGYGGSDLGVQLNATAFEERFEHLVDDEWNLAEDDWNPMCGLTYNFGAILRSLSVLRCPITRMCAYLWIPPEFGWNAKYYLYGVDLSAFVSLKEDREFREGLAAAFPGLHTLKLAIQAPALAVRNTKNDSPQDWVGELLALAPNLQHLALWCDALDSPDEKAWNSKVLHELRTVQLPRLEELELANAVVHPADLKHWLCINRHSLARLTLRRIRLRDEGHKCRDHSWCDIFHALNPLQNLRSIKLSCLYTTDGYLVVFDGHERASCKVCQPPENHRARYYCELGCRHVSYASDEGLWPQQMEVAEIDWRDPAIAGGG